MAARTRKPKSSDSYKLLCGTCPDDQCQAKLFFPAYEKSVECSQCGQRHEQSLLQNVAEVTNPSVALHNLLKNILLGNTKPKKGPDSVKVLGLSNYVCKLISPILTTHGMDKKAGRARPLKEMGQGEVFDCGRILGDRAFLIEEENLNVIGYGRDRSGSTTYLADTLRDIAQFNNGENVLVPIHADGDGHCLVHAISRALVGRELFWHALRVRLGNHLKENLEKYRQLFNDFIDTSEWEDIISECDPYYIPPEGEPLGLRNIHIFGLANVLKRPIILLDSKSGMQSIGDYSGVFLPGLVAPEECRGKDGTLNKPLVLAWSSSGRNHYIPLVGIKGKLPAMLPSYMIQRAWGMPKEEIKKYIEFDSKYRCTVGGDKCLTDRYIRQLVTAMEDVFTLQYGVHPSLVADVHQFIYRSSGIVGVLPDEVIQRTQRAIQEQLLYRCLTCEALVEYHLPKELFVRGGSLYKLAISIYKELLPDKHYSFPTQGAVCSYDKEKDCLVPDMSRSHPSTCAFCSGEMMRQVKEDGGIVYKNGDRTTTRSEGGKCPCGYKHYWDGKEYDNLPEIFPITLQWSGQVIAEKISWFQYEMDPSLNSNVFEVAQGVVQKHFPGEFGSERLVQRVVDTILAQTAAASRRKDAEADDTPPEPDPWSAETASKIILTGHAHKTLHKEELMKSEKEKAVRNKVQANAPKQQQRKTVETQSHAHAKKSPSATVTKSGSPTTSPSRTVPSKSEIQSTSGAAAGEKKVKLGTSDGRQVTLTLVNPVTYSELQKLIFQAVEIPANQQRIRLGFPPRVIHPPQEGEEDAIIPLNHGDKVTLEILHNTPVPTPTPSLAPTREPTTSHPVECEPVSALPQQQQKHRSWSSFDENATSQSAEALLSALKQTHNSGDSIDTSVASLAIMSAISGKDVWTYVQSMPHLFSVGGLLYNQVQRDLGLVDGKHCQLPTLPGKVFRYNGNEDRLELCLEPYGHFPVEPDIENKVKQGSVLPGHEGPVFRFGTSGAVHHGADQVAFSGQGHSLKSNANERMPQDLMCAAPRPQARGFHDLCTSHTRHDSIAEEPEKMQVETAGDASVVQADSHSMYQRRLGPGFSVIDPTTTNDHNSNLEMFRALAESIEKTLSEEKEEDSETSDMEIRKFSGVTSRSVAMETSSVVPTDGTGNQGRSGAGSGPVSETMETEQSAIENTVITNDAAVMETDVVAVETGMDSVVREEARDAAALMGPEMEMAENTGDVSCKSRLPDYEIGICDQGNSPEANDDAAADSDMLTGAGACSSPVVDRLKESRVTDVIASKDESVDDQQKVAVTGEGHVEGETDTVPQQQKDSSSDRGQSPDKGST